MPGHSLLHLHQNLDHTLVDPGDGGTILVDRSPAIITLACGSGETRVLTDPGVDGLSVTVVLSSGTCSISSTGLDVSLSSGEAATLVSTGSTWARITGGSSSYLVNVKDHGATGGGTVDDSEAINAAITAAGTTDVVYFPPGTYLCEADLVTGVSLRMEGDNATIKFSGNFKLDGDALRNECYIKGITFDGNNDSVLIAQIRGGDVIVSECVFKNAFNSAGVSRAINVALVTNKLLIEKCRFLDITGVSDGTVGNEAGAVRAIQMDATLPHALIIGCEFNNINNVESLGGKVTFEDADAIAMQASSNEPQHGTISGCIFTNCGKRAVKIQSFVGSEWHIEGCVVNSSWTSQEIESVDTGTDTITITGHGFEDDERIEVWSDDTLPSGLATSTLYYVVNSTTDTFQLSTSSGGGAASISDTGTGTHSAAVSHTMSAVFAVTTGATMSISDTTLKGGGAQRFAASTGKLTITNCTSEQESRWFSETGSTAAVEVGSVNDVFVNNCYFEGFRYGIYQTDASRCYVNNSTIKAIQICCNPVAAANAEIHVVGGRLDHDTHFTTSSRYCVLLEDGSIRAASFTGVVFDGMRDSITKESDAGSYQLRISNPVFDTVVNKITMSDADGWSYTSVTGYSQSGSGSPSGSITPDWVGQEYLDTSGNAWYKAYGLTNTDWQAL